MAHPKRRKITTKQDKQRVAAKQAMKKKNVKAQNEELRVRLDRTVLQEELLHKIHGIPDSSSSQDISHPISDIDGSLTEITGILHGL